MRVLNVASSRSRERPLDHRTDPLGLSVLYFPASPSSADIIFIHGLGGSSRKTWSRDGNPELFWPFKWLPTEPALCTSRIFSFGYDANFSSSSSSAISNLSDFAKSLLFSLKFGKHKDGKDLGIGNYPIIFVAHSMGGLVFKKAYIQAQGNDDYQSIIKSIFGVLFLSTPHRGTHLAGILNRILAVSVFGHTSKKYLVELDKNSSSIEDLNESFRNFASSLKIFSFYETLETSIGPKKMMVLDKDSSMLGYPGETSQPLNADHHNVCKFSSTSDPDYISVRSALMTLVSMHTTAREKFDRPSLTAQYGLVDLLGVSVAPLDDLILLQSLWTPGTCEGVLSHSVYRKWKENLYESKILWIKAQPGGGKSVLASFLITRFIELGSKCAYFFFKQDDSTKRSVSSLLRSLAFQISQFCPSFQKALSKMEDDGLRFEKLDAKLIWQNIFVDILFRLVDNFPIYWVIDALDESESADNILGLFSGVGQSRPPIHIIVLSRLIPSITRALERVSSFVSLATISLDQNITDIRLHTSKEIRYLRGPAEFRQEIINQIVDRAEGSFLWVSLVLKEILECDSYGEIKRALEVIPSGMHSLYQRMEETVRALPKTSDKSLARDIMIWATYSRRPLGANELVEALQPKLSEVFDIKFTINRLCGHFVIVDNNNFVSLTHRTAREYLMKTQNLPFSMAPRDAQKEIFIRTISVFFDRQLRPQLDESFLSAFCSYSATSWAHHLIKVPAESEEAFDKLVRFFQGPYVLRWIQALAILGQLDVLVFTSQSLTSFAQKCRKLNAIKTPSLYRFSDIQLLELWIIDLPKLVGKFGSNLLQEPSTIYGCIAQFSPRNSAVYQQFSKIATARIWVSGLSNEEWDDCLARISIGNEHRALLVTSSGRHLAVLSSNGTIHVWSSLTFEKISVLEHNEHVFSICFNRSGDRLASYGYITTRVWEVSMGHQLFKISNPANSRALCLNFTDNDKALIMGSELRNIQKTHFGKPENDWQMADISFASKESTLKGTFPNTPTTMAFDPDVTKVAIAYRGSPMTVWTLEKPRCINKCRRRYRPDKSPSVNWTGVSRVVWHPNNGELLGIYNDGVVFKWHPFEESHDELKSDNRGTPSEIQCSRDGLVFATSNVNGAIKIFDYERLTIIYQLSSEDIVTALCFDAGSPRLYDLRRSYCNAWGPDMLIRRTTPDEEIPDPDLDPDIDTDTDSDTETQSTKTSLLSSEAWIMDDAPITALSARSDGLVFCSGNDDGRVELHGIGNDKKLLVGNSAAEMSIDHLAWAEDGGTFAYAELGGNIVVKSFSTCAYDDGKLEWHCETVMKLKPSLDAAGIIQILLSSNFLLIKNAESVQLWRIEDKSVRGSHQLSQAEARNRWITHPAKPNQLLAFSAETVAMYKWESLEKLVEWKMDFPWAEGAVGEIAPNIPILPRKNSSGEAISRIEPEYQVEQVIATPLSDYILVHISQQSPSFARTSYLQIIKSSSLTKPTSEFPHPQSLSTIPIPTEISRALEKPLGIIGNDLLVFLDKSLWVWTYQIDQVASPQDIKPKRHFFLPRDWINAESLALCQALPDGTILCPRRGEVAVIRNDMASGW